MTASSQPTDALQERLEELVRNCELAPSGHVRDKAALARAVIQLRERMQFVGYSMYLEKIDAALSKALGVEQ